MDSEVRFIDMRQFFKYLLRRIWILLAAAVLCGGLLAVYKHSKQEEASEVDLLEMTMQQNHDAYYLKTVKYSDALPYTGIYNSSAKLYIDFDYSDIENYENANVSDINSKFENDAIMITWDYKILGEIIDELNLTSYNDMKDINQEKLQWLINRNFQGAHVMNIVVSDTDPERAQAICGLLVKKFEEKTKALGFVDSVKEINGATLPKAAGLYGQSAGDTGAKTVDNKTLIKFGLIGAVGGALLAALVYFVIYIVRDVVRDKADMKSVDLDMMTGSQRAKEEYGRIARAIDIYDDIKNILLVSVDSYVEAEKYAEGIQAEMKKLGSEKKLSFAENFKGCNDSLEKVKNCDAIVYLTRYNKTKLADITDARKVLEKSNARCLGGIII
ncbi:MAG: hypothetical protein IJJ74_07330 [Eubacterium sp.]|nr:hypothetical protein [Eubacterium sp.]